MRRSLVKRTGHDKVAIRLLSAGACLRDARAGRGWLSSDREQRLKFQGTLGILVHHRGANHSSSCRIRTAGQTAFGMWEFTVLALQIPSWFLCLRVAVVAMCCPAPCARRPAGLSLHCHVRCRTDTRPALRHAPQKFSEARHEDRSPIATRCHRRDGRRVAARHRLARCRCKGRRRLLGWAGWKLRREERCREGGLSSAWCTPSVIPK